MGEREKLKFLSAYLKYKKKEIIVFFVFSAVFAVSFFMYHLPLKAVAYPVLLCLIIGAAILAVSIKNSYGKHKELERLSTLSSSLIREFPEASCTEDDDYTGIIKLLCEEQRQLLSSMNRKYSDMTDYYTMWAHQIKTPIASMKLQLEKEDSSFSRKMSSELFRIEQYVEMVLVFLRLDSETTDYVIKEYSVDEIVRQAINKFSGDFISRKLSLSYEPIDAKAVTDEKWLSFVVEQVLSNALKYTPAGGTIRIYGDGTTVAIADSGIGIREEDQARVFEKGFTGYNGRADKKSTGIGLYLCRQVMNRLNHSISLTSRPGQGTLVRLDLSRENRIVE